MLKVKRDERGTSRPVFVVIWMIAMFIASFLSSLVISQIIAAVLQETSIIDSLNVILLTGSLGLLFGALTQVQVVERALKRTMRGWTLYTVAGLVTTLVLYFVLRLPVVVEAPIWAEIPRDWRMPLYTVGAALIPSLPALGFQWLWLRRHAKNAWLWPVVGLIAALVSRGVTDFAIYNLDNAISVLPPLQFGVSLVFWFVTSLTMYHIREDAPAMIKAKNTTATHNDVISQERIERLQESTDETPLPTDDSYEHRKQEVL